MGQLGEVRPSGLVALRINGERAGGVVIAEQGEVRR